MKLAIRQREGWVYTMKKRLATTMLALLLCLSACISAQAKEGTAAKPEYNDQNMPYVLTYFNGTALDLSAYEGKAIFLNFFTEWCGYCMQEMPAIKRIWQEYAGDQFAVVMVHVWSGEDGAATERVKAKYEMQDMTFVEDKDTSLADSIGLEGFPTSLFIDQEGYLLGQTNALDYDSLVQIMDMLSLKPVAQQTTVKLAD